MDRIRVLIVEDQKTTRETLAQLLALETDIEVVGAAPNGAEGLRLARELRPQIILTDIDMPLMNGIDLTAQVKREMPEVGIVVLTIYHDDANVFRAIKAGATGYVLKDSPSEETVHAIRTIYRGESLLHPSIAARVLAEFNRINGQKAMDMELFKSLSDREVEVLKEVATGKRNREIGETLFISEKTVKNHISSILLKLQVNDRTEAALLAARGGLI